MVRRRFYIPKTECERDYRKKGDLNPNDFIMRSEFIQEAINEDYEDDFDGSRD